MTKGNWKQMWLRATAIVLFTIAAYLPALDAGFIWDDNDHLTQNPCVIGPLGLKEIWTSTRAIYYPLVLTSFWALHKIVELNPLPYHLLNIMMHSGSALLLWHGLRQLRIRAAWLGAMLWALHPLTVQSVAWVTELKNTQSCFFYLLSILLFLKADNNRTIDPRKFRWLFALSLLSFILAITSKTATVMLPVVLVLCLWWRNGSVRTRDLVLLAPFFLVAAAAAGWTVYEQRFLSLAIGPDWTQSWAQRLVIAGWNLWFYLAKIVWPHPLIFIYPRWKIETTEFLDFVPLLAAVAGLFLLWRNRNGLSRPVFFAAVYFVVSLFPVLGFFNVYFFKYSFVSDHFQYLACIGPLALAGGALWTTGSLSFSRRLWRLAVAGTVLLTLGLLTWRQTTTYRDAETLYRTTIARNPACWMAYNNLGSKLYQANRIPEAMDLFKQALRIKPNYAEVHNNLGNALVLTGRTSEAIDQYKQALRINSDYAEVHNNLGNALVLTGRSSEAIDQYKEALRINPDYAEVHSNLGALLGQMGRISEAIEQLKAALRIKPNYPVAQNNLTKLQALQKITPTKK